jgi:hypothetical protein
MMLLHGWSSDSAAIEFERVLCRNPQHVETNIMTTTL